MKILQINSGSVKIPSDKGGAIASVILNISSIISSKHDVTILDRYYSSTDLKKDSIQTVKIVRLNALRFNFNRLFMFPIQFVLNELIYGYKVRKYLNKHEIEFDVIHLHTPITGFIAMVYNSKIFHKTVYTSHVHLWSLDKQNLGVMEKIMLLVETYVLKTVEKVIALDSSIKIKMINEKIPASKIEIIGNGVNINNFEPKSKNNINDNYFNILFVGRITKVKGIDYLIKSLNILVNKEKKQNIKLHVVGPTRAFGLNKISQSEYMSELNNLVELYNLGNNIKFVGEVSDETLKSLYTNTDLFVLPSLGEAYPLVILEAMASGKPIVGTKISGISSMVKHGENGLLVKPANENELSEAILYCLNNQDELIRWGFNSRKFSQDLGWDSISKKIISFYEKNIQ